MEPLARWIRREFDWSVPWPVVVWPMIVGAIPLWMITSGNVSQSALAICALCVPVMFAPAAIHSYRNRHRVKLHGLVSAARRGPLPEAIGPRAGQLNEAALDLEQILNSLRQDSASSLDRKGLMARSKERFRRAFDLSLGAAAAYSFTRDGAERQIDADLEWLRQVRQHCEKLLLSPNNSDVSLEHLHELEALVAAREEAIEELGLRG